MGGQWHPNGIPMAPLNQDKISLWNHERTGERQGATFVVQWHHLGRIWVRFGEDLGEIWEGFLI